VYASEADMCVQASGGCAHARLVVAVDDCVVRSRSRPAFIAPPAATLDVDDVDEE
jgi:hypothetical protein